MARTPLYRRVEDELTARIGQMRPGDMIPPEPELERIYGVSRATIRRAVEDLERKGVVEKRQGLGTIVRELPETQDVGMLYSWTDEMRRRNVPSSSRLIGLRREHPSRRIAEELRLSAGDWVVVLARVRTVKDAPVAIMVNYLREDHVPGLVERGLTSESLYHDLRESFGIELIEGDETIRARTATAAEAALLEVEEGAAVLNVRRVSFIRGRVPLEVVDMTARGDKYQYHATLGRRSPVRSDS